MIVALFVVVTVAANGIGELPPPPPPLDDSAPSDNETAPAPSPAPADEEPPVLKPIKPIKPAPPSPPSSSPKAVAEPEGLDGFLIGGLQ